VSDEAIHAAGRAESVIARSAATKQSMPPGARHGLLRLRLAMTGEPTWPARRASTSWPTGAEAIASLRQLRESIEEFVFERIPSGVRPTRGDYNGSLAGLVKLASLAKRVVPEEKFVIIIDEFDEIHQELYIYGNLADTFFANLRALSRSENVCIILIGGENMPFIMGRQGQKLNNFSRENLSYFSRQTEWEDFQLLVGGPIRDLLNWHDDAVSEVFNTTHGNPYFAKIICARVFRSAVTERDADITATEVRRASDSAISAMGANSFAHLWQDGIPKAATEREPDILRRMRVLVAIARCLRRGMPATASNIFNNRSSSSLSEGEIAAVLNDFQRREVLREEGHRYLVELPIFGMWLVDVGTSQLISDAMSEELANIALLEENAAVVRSEEVVNLAKAWPTYRGRHIGTDEIKAWYQQVDNPRDQRLLFELLKRTRVFSETHIRERLKSAHALLRSSLPEFVIRKRGDRRPAAAGTGRRNSSPRSFREFAREFRAARAPDRALRPPGGETPASRAASQS
jgi:hypothetical protein